MIDCNGISWLIGVTFDLQYGYIPYWFVICLLVDMAICKTREILIYGIRAKP